VVLVVEDNPEVRAFSVMSLSELGYRVLQAADAEAALSILRSDHRVDLLFTHVVLPGRTGRVLAEESTIARPGLKVLFTTGYSRNAIVHHGRLMRECGCFRNRSRSISSRVAYGKCSTNQQNEADAPVIRRCLSSRWQRVEVAGYYRPILSPPLSRNASTPAG
jgi:CheY-like chemotaxis protein